MQPHIISDGLLTLSLEVYHYVLQLGEYFLKIVATVLLGRLVFSKIFEIVAPPFAIPTMKERSPFFNFGCLDDTPD